MKELQNEKLKLQLMESSDYLTYFSFDAAPESRLFKVTAGEFIIEEGCSPTYLFYLARGVAKLYATLNNGKVALIDFFAAPCFLGEMELIDATCEAKAVQAIEDCWCLALPMNQFRAQLLDDVRFLRSICTYLNQKFYRNITTTTQNQSFPLANRLAAFILLTQNQGCYREKHTQVAEYLGVSYRHLLYVMAEFTKKGILKKQGRTYLIQDKEALSAIAKEMEPEIGE